MRCTPALFLAGLAMPAMTSAAKCPSITGKDSFLLYLQFTGYSTLYNEQLAIADFDPTLNPPTFPNGDSGLTPNFPSGQADTVFRLENEALVSVTNPYDVTFYTSLIFNYTNLRFHPKQEAGLFDVDLALVQGPGKNSTTCYLSFQGHTSNFALCQNDEFAMDGDSRRFVTYNGTTRRAGPACTPIEVVAVKTS